MKKTAAIALALTGVAACAGLASGQTPTTTSVMVNEDNPARPLIWINQEPIIVRNKAVITWELTTKGYEFPKDGIVFADKAVFVDCRPTKPQTFQCVDTFSRLGTFKYTINVRATDKKVDPRPLDPTVVNDR